ncbi:hypothetical protein OROHE_024720 [Orobanche hederae]
MPAELDVQTIQRLVSKRNKATQQEDLAVRTTRRATTDNQTRHPMLQLLGRLAKSNFPGSGRITYLCDDYVFMNERVKAFIGMKECNDILALAEIGGNVVMVYMATILPKKLTTGDTASDELGAKYGPNWLKGRCFKSGMSSSNPPTETYVKELTIRIKESLASVCNCYK